MIKKGMITALWVKRSEQHTTLYYITLQDPEIVFSHIFFFNPLQRFYILNVLHGCCVATFFVYQQLDKPPLHNSNNSSSQYAALSLIPPPGVTTLNFQSYAIWH